MIIDELISFFGKFANKYFGRYLKSLEQCVEQSNLPIIYERYIGELFFITFLAFNFIFVGFLYFFLLFFQLNFIFSLISAILLTSVLTSMVWTIYYLKPFLILSSQKESIDKHLPFAINHMKILAYSGLPLHIIFKSIAKKSYGEVSREASRIIKYMQFLGKDISNAVKEVAMRTPSEKLRKYLEGLYATIVSGGDLFHYLDNESELAIQEYKIEQKKKIETLTFLLEAYILLFLVAPTLLVIIASILSSTALSQETLSSLFLKNILNFTIFIFLPIAGIGFLIALNKIVD